MENIAHFISYKKQ